MLVDDWELYESKNFELFTNTEEKKARGIIVDLELFRAQRFEVALAMMPWSARLRLRAGLAYQAAGKIDSAIDNLELALVWTENSTIRAQAAAALAELAR